MSKKIEAKISKCYLVEVVVDNVDTYYRSEYVFTGYQEAKKLKEKMVKDAAKTVQSNKHH